MFKIENVDFMSFYNELLELYEAKNKSDKNGQGTKQSQSFSAHIEKVCTPLPSVISGMPKEQSGFLLYVTPKFINHYNELVSKHPAPEIAKLHSNMQKGIGFLQKTGRVTHKDLYTETLHDSCLCTSAWRLNRISGTPVRAHVILAHDSATNKKYFILATLFLHREKRLTNDEVTLGNSEYNKIYDYSKISAKKSN